MGGRCGGGVCLVITVATWSIICMLSSTVAELSRLEHPITKNDGQLRFLVIGDWGRKGKYNQSQVALQMGIIGEKLNIDFVISVGDNFYEDGLTSVDDPAFDESFSNIYNMKSLGKQWYNVLGNHDYRGDVEAQLSPILRKVGERWICMRSFIVNAEFLDIFFVDTTPFVNKYFTNPDGHTYDWRGVLPRETYIKNLLMDVDSSLKESDAKWKIVVGHHTMRSAGEHGDTEELVKQLLPILEANGVDLYVNGHDHCLQHISNNTSNIQFLTSGGGSKAWRGGIDLKKEGLKFYYDGQGFMSIQLTKEFANIVFYDIFGDVLHKLSLSKNLYMGTKTYVQ